MWFPRFRRTTVQWIGLAAGPSLAGAVYLLLPDSYIAAGGGTIELGHAGRATAALGSWMAVWWMTEAIPIYATALLPLSLFSLFGVTSIRQAATPYGHELIFLFMGGFILALSMQRWGLHRRFALGTLSFVGSKPRRIVAGFMFVTAMLSMWVSNTATTITMLPIALSVISMTRERQGSANFAACLFLGIAYAASIGGIGTLIGTPPNLFLASFVERQMGRTVGFTTWMGIGIPLVLVFLPVTWWLLTRVLFSFPDDTLEGEEAALEKEREGLGPMNRGERITLFVFALTAACWITRPLLAKLEVFGARPLAGLTDTGIAVSAAVALFLIPVDARSRRFTMNWETAVKLPWGILILFGGGLSLAAAVQGNGVGAYLGFKVGSLAGVPGIVLVLFVTALMIFLTELTSNTASTATFVPILFSIAPALGMDPLLLIVPATIAASCAFMLPVATPPNAIVFGSGRVTIPQMCRAGIWLNLIGIGLVTGLVYALAVPLLGR